MALNTSHAHEGVLLHAGESILLFCDNVKISFSGSQGVSEFSGGDKHGRLYLTTHRMIFNNKNMKDSLKSFSFPFVALRDVELEQPIFGANYIKGRVIAQPNGNWQGEAKFKLHFKSGGAIDFGTAMLKSAQMASRNYSHDGPPPYTPPSGPWYAAPPPAYTPNPNGYMGWVPPTHIFTEQPPPNSVYMTDAPPPYPGINGYHVYASAPVATGAEASATSSSAEAKAAEASAPPVQTGYHYHNQPGTVFLPPSDDCPPSYDESLKKNN